ncbi:MAG: hybrid sensor histidine kinase/response regulator [Candidatus Sericytochromatia bacterium]|nr:hybrid sensor histidine kinase/response regulator [Candidatus Sericytochromatia bacterium]
MPQILIIETDSDLREELRDLLTYERFEVLEASDGDSAWRQLQQERPDLILSCVQYGEGNGFDWLKKLRQSPEYAAIPLLFLTGLASPEDMRKAMNLGADDYLVKPVRSLDLMQAIQTRLQRMQDIQAPQQHGFEHYRHSLLRHFPHEVFTPLNALLGSARVLQSRFRDLPPHRIEQMAHSLMRNGSRLFHLLQNQLMFLELETWEHLDQQPWKEQVTGVESTRVIEQICREKGRYYGRESDLQLQLQPARVMLLEKHLQIIVRELIDNALKFSPEGSPVLLNSRILPTGQWFLKVLNTGSGMNAEQIESIQAFQQFNRSRQEQQGLGLGLSLCKRLLSCYHASLEIESRPERYIQFSLTLPTTA